MSITLNATDCPAVQVAPGIPSPAAAYASSNGLAANARNLATSGQSTGFTASFNENAQRIDDAYMIPGGMVRCIVSGLTLSATGLTATVAIGGAVLNGLKEVSTAITGIALTPSTNNYLWLRQSGVVTVMAGTTAAPSNTTTNAAVYLGMLQTDGSGVTLTDYSGVVYQGGITGRYRQTADTGKPSDTPPAGATLDTVTASGGTWIWEGPANTYWLLSSDRLVENEAPTGACDGTNTTFTLAHAPLAGSLKLYLGATSDGLLSRLLASGTPAYSLSGNTITMATAPASGKILIADYRY